MFFIKIIYNPNNILLKSLKCFSTGKEVEQNIQPDHNIHMLIEILPRYAVSTVIGKLKGIRSRLLRQKFDYLRRRRTMWSVGYFVS